MLGSQSPGPVLDVWEGARVELLYGAEVEAMFQPSARSPMDGCVLTGVKYEIERRLHLNLQI